jgi:eukaryotic-like serine/threonine-protein kinase
MRDRTPGPWNQSVSVINQTISHYRITGQLGSGGMGVVYEAEDLKLGRKVALKFLPPQRSSDKNALDRFMLEARTASALNHPNICVIYAVETATVENKEVQFIAMELLEGQSLDHKIVASPFPTDRLLDIAIQLADALDAAHAKGIIHRDIKPANIFLTPRGQVKVLDFGLAKLARTHLQATLGGATSDEATIAYARSPNAMQLTNPGAAVGTISYMSPEQARGEELDTRTDLFSLGTVLYQMATGKLPFDGATSAVVFNGILQNDPAPLSQLNPALPAKLQEIVEELLEKDRDLRYQSAADLRGDLKRLKRDVESGRKPASAASPIASTGESGQSSARASSSSQTQITPAPTAPSRGALRYAVPIVALLLAGCLAYVIFFRTKSVPFQNFTVTKVTESGNASQVAISPDGKYILTLLEDSGLFSLQLRNLPTNSVTQVQPPLKVKYVGLRFSPDGNYLYFVRTDPGNDKLYFLYRAPLLGGAPEKLAEDVGSNVTFSPDGEKLAFLRYEQPKPGDNQLIIKDLQSGTENPLLTRTYSQLYTEPAWSPDGKVIVYSTLQPEDGALMGLDAVNPETGQTKPVTRAKDGILLTPEWLPDMSGLLVRYSDPTVNYQYRQMVIVRYPDGQRTAVTRDTINYDSLSVARQANIVAAVMGTDAWNLQIVKGAASDLKTVSKTASTLTFDWSQAGNLIVGKDLHLITIDAETGIQSPFGASNASLAESPKRCGSDAVIFRKMLFENGKMQAHVSISDIAGQKQRQLSSGALDGPAVCSHDGKWVYFESDKGVFQVPFEGGVEPKRLLEDQVYGFDVSTDGSSLLFATLSRAEGQKIRVAEMAVGAGVIRREIGLQKTYQANGYRPDLRYSPDGKAIEYVARENGVDNIWRQPLDGSAGKWETTFKTEQIAAFSWSPDGKQLAMVRGHTDSDVVLIKDQKQ